MINGTNNNSNIDYQNNQILINLFDIKTAKEWVKGLDNLLYFMVMDTEIDTQVSQFRDFYSDIFLLKREFEKL